MTPAHFRAWATTELHMATDHAFYARTAMRLPRLRGDVRRRAGRHLRRRAASTSPSGRGRTWIASRTATPGRVEHCRQGRGHADARQIHAHQFGARGRRRPPRPAKERKTDPKYRAPPPGQAPIDNAMYTTRESRNRPFFSEKFHLVRDTPVAHRSRTSPRRRSARRRQRPAPAASMAALARARPTPTTRCCAPGGTPSPTAPRRPADPSSARADATSQTRPQLKRRKISSAGDAVRRATASMAGRAGRRSDGVCKNRTGKVDDPARPGDDAPEVRPRGLADKRRHADRVAAKAALYARGARIRNSAKGR